MPPRPASRPNTSPITISSWTELLILARAQGAPCADILRVGLCDWLEDHGVAVPARLRAAPAGRTVAAGHPPVPPQARLALERAGWSREALRAAAPAVVAREVARTVGGLSVTLAARAVAEAQGVDAGPVESAARQSRTSRVAQGELMVRLERAGAHLLAQSAERELDRLDRAAHLDGERWRRP